MKKITVTRQDGVFDVLLMKHKTFQGYSFINLTKQHICPCVFDTEEDAIKDLERAYKFVDEQIGWLLDNAIDDDTTFCVVSDHGGVGPEIEFRFFDFIKIL